MQVVTRQSILLAVVLTFGSTAVVADPSTGSRKKAADPNEIVCEKQEVLGSRLAMKRVCKTRAEWAEQRLQDRQAIEKAQTERGTTGN